MLEEYAKGLPLSSEEEKILEGWASLPFPKMPVSWEEESEIQKLRKNELTGVKLL